MHNLLPPHPISTKLSVPADMRFWGMVQGYIRHLAEVAGFTEQEGMALELAAEESFMNILQHAFPGQRPGDVFWESELTQTELVLSIRDEGIPFDATQALKKQTGQPDDGHEDLEQGLGLRLIRHAVDEACFENLGWRGKVLRLRKRLPQALAEPLAEAQPRQAEPAPMQHYAVRPMQPEEAKQVARVFWLAYGYTYKNEAFYRPEEILHLIGSGRLISMVAVAENGEVVGHAGLLRSKPVPVAEQALLAVSPAHRGRGLTAALSGALREKAMEMGLKGRTWNAVTSHDISQRVVIHEGGSPCGLDLAACMPRRFKALEAESAPPQRESFLYSFQYLSRPPLARVNLPPRHRQMAGRIYDALAQSYRWEDGSPADMRGSYQVDYDKTAKRGLIVVVSADERQWPEILRAARDLEQIGGAEVVCLDLPLAQPASVLLCQLAEDVGFSFSCIRPCEAAEGDNLRLVRLTVDLDLSRLRVYSELSQELLSYVAAEFEAAKSKPRS